MQQKTEAGKAKIFRPTRSYKIGYIKLNDEHYQFVDFRNYSDEEVTAVYVRLLRDKCLNDIKKLCQRTPA